LECRLERFIELGSHRLVIGEVVMFHLRDALYVDGTVDVERLRPIARLSKNNYTWCGDIFEMIRPK
jgi:flavin reductase (DIM6/NTAB) family NADH-FMN oxidoreductase RutF